MLATLAPSVAHALRHLRGETMPWSQLCSASGTKRVVFEWQGDAQGSSPGAHAFEPCGFCTLHHDGWAPPPDAAAVAPRAELQALAPTARLVRVHASLVWFPAQPRAPPHQA
jgi:hypothetical protein